MTDYGKYDLMRMAGLRPKPVDQEKKRYGGFNRRMMAATIDSLLISIIVGPIVDYVFTAMYGPLTVDLYDLSEQTSGMANSANAMHMFWQGLKSGGAVDRWVANMGWQTAAFLLYSWVCWHFWSATLGKMLLRLKIVDEETGEPMDGSQCMIRLAGYLVSALPFGLGFCWMGIDKKKRGLHDILAETVVVTVPWRKDASVRLVPPAAPLSNSPAPSPTE